MSWQPSSGTQNKAGLWRGEKIQVSQLACCAIDFLGRLKTLQERHPMLADSITCMSQCV
jgi:hypothetical protein